MNTVGQLLQFPVHALSTTHLDPLLAKYLSRRPETVPIKLARVVQGLSMREVAEKAGQTAQNWHAAETRAFRGDMSINNLRKMAKAVNCELELRLVPSDGFEFSHRYRFMLLRPPFIKLWRKH